jgi:lysophospholipase L1-like esterase
MRNLLRNLALSLAVLIICLFLADRALPLFIPVAKATLESDPLLGLKGRPEVNTICIREIPHPIPLHLNRSGFHDYERSMQKRLGTFRIITLGDSFVEAYQVPLQENFSQLLEQSLNRDELSAAGGERRRIEVYNQGVHGYGLGAYYLYVEHRLDAWSPDALVLCFFLGNDFVDNYYPLATHVVPRFGINDGSLVFYPPEETRMTWLRDHVLAHSNIAVTLGEAIRANSGLLAIARNNGFVSWAPTQRLSEQQRSEVLAIARLQFHGIKEHLAARHVRLFVLGIPDPFRVRDVAAGHIDPDLAGTAPNDRAFVEQGFLTILETEGIPHVYPLNLFVNQVRQGHSMYLNNAGHLTADGHRHIAEALEEPLRQMVEAGAEPASRPSSDPESANESSASR